MLRSCSWVSGERGGVVAASSTDGMLGRAPRTRAPTVQDIAQEARRM